MLWSIDIIDSGNRTGSLEFVVPNTRPETFFPVTVNFNATRTLCQVCRHSRTLLSCMCSLHQGASFPVWNIWATLQISAPSAAELSSIVTPPEAEAYDSALYATVHTAIRLYTTCSENRQLCFHNNVVIFASWACYAVLGWRCYAAFHCTSVCCMKCIQLTCKIWFSRWKWQM